MKQENKDKYGLGNSPVNCILKRLGLIDKIKPVDPPQHLDDLKAKEEIIDIFRDPHSPIIVYSGHKGKDWLVYLRRHFKKRSPFFLHIGFPSIQKSGWMKGEKEIFPMGHLSLAIPSLHQILTFLSRANEMRCVSEVERLLIFSIFGWKFSFESKKKLEHSLKINDVTKIIKKINDKVNGVNGKELHTWEQIKSEFDFKREDAEETDSKIIQEKIQIRGFLKVIERHWQFKSHSSKPKKKHNE